MFKAITILSIVLFVASIACLDSGSILPVVTWCASGAWIFYVLRKIDKKEVDRDV